MKKWKKIVLITGGAIVALVAAIIVFIVLVFPKGFLSSMLLPMNDSRGHLETVACRHDLKPLQTDFENIKGMKKVYWKTDTVGGPLPGSYDYYVGFIVLDQTEFEKLKTEYSWEKATPDFPTGLQPEVTGYHDFNWVYNDDFCNKVCGNDYYGAVDLDLNNGVIFIYVDDGR